VLFGHVPQIRFRAAVTFEAAGELKEYLRQITLGRPKSLGWVEGLQVFGLANHGDRVAAKTRKKKKKQEGCTP